jgi:RhtB (resistance to homoserine/threonine) family protein
MMMNHYWAFVATSILLILSPGIDTALVTRNTVAYSAKGGFFTAFGIANGVLVHTLAAGLGLSVILMQSARLFEIFKLIAAAYLIFLGLKSFRNRATQIQVQAGQLTYMQRHIPQRLFRQGILTNILNPKVALFFLTFLPQFTDTTHGFFHQILFLGLTYSGLTLVWFLCYINLMNRLKDWIMKPTVQRYMERLTGVVLVGFGLKLAVETK